MRYHISPTYYSENENPVVKAWQRHFNDAAPHMTFQEFLTKEAGVKRVLGNFEDGWIVEFKDEAHYTWFLLKWG